MFHMNEVESVPIDRLNEIIENRKPIGLFISREKRTGRKRGLFVAVDNSTGDAWTETFEKLKDAENWLMGKFEVEG